MALVEDVDVKLLKEVPYHTLINLCKTSKVFRVMCQREDIWEAHFYKEMEHHLLLYKPFHWTWKKFYLSLAHVRNIIDDIFSIIKDNIQPIETDIKLLKYKDELLGIYYKLILKYLEKINPTELNIQYMFTTNIMLVLLTHSQTTISILYDWIDTLTIDQAKSVIELMKKYYPSYDDVIHGMIYIMVQKEQRIELENTQLAIRELNI